MEQEDAERSREPMARPARQIGGAKMRRYVMGMKIVSIGLVVLFGWVVLQVAVERSASVTGREKMTASNKPWRVVMLYHWGKSGRNNRVMRWPIVFVFARAAGATLVLDAALSSSTTDFDMDTLRSSANVLTEQEFVTALRSRGMFCNRISPVIQKEDSFASKYSCFDDLGQPLDTSPPSKLDPLSVNPVPLTRARRCQSVGFLFYSIGSSVFIYDFFVGYFDFAFCAADAGVPSWNKFWSAFVPPRAARDAANEVRQAALAMTPNRRAPFAAVHIRDLYDGEPERHGAVLSIASCAEEYANLLEKWEARHGTKLGAVYVSHDPRHAAPRAAAEQLAKLLEQSAKRQDGGRRLVVTCDQLEKCKTAQDLYGGVLDYWILVTADYMIGTNASSFSLNAWSQRRALLPHLESDIDTLGLHRGDRGRPGTFAEMYRGTTPCCRFHPAIYSDGELQPGEMEAPFQIPMRASSRRKGF